MFTAISYDFFAEDYPPKKIKVSNGNTSGTKSSATTDNLSKTRGVLKVLYLILICCFVVVIFYLSKLFYSMGDLSAAWESQKTHVLVKDNVYLLVPNDGNEHYYAFPGQIVVNESNSYIFDLNTYTIISIKNENIQRANCEEKTEKGIICKIIK